MDFIYTDKELEYARFIKANAPLKIWWDYVTYTFDYGDMHFEIESVSEAADTQNEFDEAIVGQFTKYLEPYSPGENAVLICENKAISELYIVRTFLHFTTFREYTKHDVELNKVKQELKNIVEGKSDPFEDLLSNAIGGGEEIICHPKSDQAKGANPEYSNLIDCGLLLQIEGKVLKAFVESNGFGFHIWDEKYFFDIDELNPIVGMYEFIKV